MPIMKKIGVLTGGGDAPGLNAVIRAVVKSAHNSGIEVIGLEDSFDGLIYPDKSRTLTPKDVAGILRLGGTMLGTVNRGDPFAEPIVTPEGTFNYGERVRFGPPDPPSRPSWPRPVPVDWLTSPIPRRQFACSSDAPAIWRSR